MTQPTTDEQFSGSTASAVAGLHADLSHRYTGLNLADLQLADALLAANATSAAGRRRLQDIERQLLDAIDNPLSALDTPAGQRQFLVFLRSKVAEIQQILADGSLSADTQAQLAAAVADGYVADVPAASAAAPMLPAGPAPAVPAAMGALPLPAGGLGQQAAGFPSTAATGLAALPGALSSLLADAPVSDRADRSEDPRQEQDDVPDSTGERREPPAPTPDDGTDADDSSPEDVAPAPTGPAGEEL